MNIKVLKVGAKAHNKYLTDEYLDSLGYEHLLRLNHPLQRGEYAKQLYKDGKISQQTLNKFVKVI